MQRGDRDGREVGSAYGGGGQEDGHAGRLRAARRSRDLAEIGEGDEARVVDKSFFD